ncbi:MAG: geranylgeranyl reductase family protein [Gemmatimonadaceae bacterium]
MTARNGSARKAKAPKTSYDVIVVGGGPAGATMGWSLATRGLDVLVLDRARFPREKVCGDFVEPRGLRLFQTMGCLPRLEASHPLAITHVNLFLGARSAYREHIPFYAGQTELPKHGYIIPRSELDERVLECAGEGGAEVRQGCGVTGVERVDGTMVVHYKDGSQDAERTARAPVVVGADGTHSVVARSFDLLVEDRRYMALSQRAYVDGVELANGEAAFVFDRDLFPGYGWMFPMKDGRANVGVGLLAETCDRYKISVPKLFATFLSKLQRLHPGCARIRLASKPIGGIVKTYGGRGPNYFDGGILIGDAGSFVDPMTGEGITPAAESAVIGADVIAAALERGVTDRTALAAYDRATRAYFDPAMRYLDFVACIMRNRHFGEFWLGVVARGCEMAMRDQTFARLSGAAFGGLDVRPLDIISRMWAKSLGHLAAEGTRLATEIATGRFSPASTIMDMGRWSTAWWSSLAEDPKWHTDWTSDVMRKWFGLARTVRLRDPRAKGLAPLLQLRPKAAAYSARA